MRIFVYGLRNVFRNGARSLLVIVLIGLSVSIFLTMWQVSSLSKQQSDTLRAQVATLIQVTPVGSAPGGGSRVTLSEEVEGKIQTVANITSIEKVIRRQFWDNSKQFSMGALTGIEPGKTLRFAAMGGFTGNPKIVSGRTFAKEDEGQNVAVVGKIFASQYNLSVGSEFTLPASVLAGRGEKDPNVKELKAQVIGIHEVGVVYGDNQIFVPLSVAQKALAQENQVSQFYVLANSADNVKQVEDDLKKVLGSTADLLAEQASAKLAAESLTKTSNNSLLSSLVAAGVGALVILFTMMLVTRERTREIGIFKAIGAPDFYIAKQFIVETFVLTLAGTLLGIVFSFLSGSIIASISLPWDSVIKALLLALVFGSLGSLYPVREALRMRPVEAIRAT